MGEQLSPQSIVVAASEQVSCPLGVESAILNLKNSVYYGANPVAASVWKLLQQPKTVCEVRDALLEEYDVEPERRERDLLALLHKTKDEGKLFWDSRSTSTRAVASHTGFILNDAMCQT